MLKLLSQPKQTLLSEELHNSYTPGPVCECVGVFVCKPSPPVTCGHVVQSWPILGRQGEEESRSKEGGRCGVLHQIIVTDKCILS